MCHIDCLRVHCRRMTGGLTLAGADSLEKLVDDVSGIPANSYNSTSLELTKTTYNGFRFLFSFYTKHTSI